MFRNWQILPGSIRHPFFAVFEGYKVRAGKINFIKPPISKFVPYRLSDCSNLRYIEFCSLLPVFIAVWRRYSIRQGYSRSREALLLLGIAIKYSDHFRFCHC